MSAVRLTQSDKSLLRRVAERVRHGNWIQGDYGFDVKGPHCLIGFVNTELGIFPETDSGTRYVYCGEDGDEPAPEKVVKARDRIITRLAEAIDRLYGDHSYTSTVESWNDLPDTREKDVLRVLDVATGDTRK